MKRRTVVSLLAVTALSLCAGCSSKEQTTTAPSEKTKVKLALNWVPEPEFGGCYAAREHKIFDKHGLDVEIVPGGANVPVLQMVSGGQAEFGISGADEVLMAKARGADIVALFAVYQKSPMAIMAHPEHAKVLNDVFAGGTLALEPGLPYAKYLKENYGFDKVKIVPYDGGVARFVAEKDFAQQCFITSEPFAAQKKGVVPNVFLVADYGFNPYLVVIIAKRSTWLEKKDVAKKFVAASREGWQKYLDEPGPTNKVMGKLNTAMDAKTFDYAAAAQKPLIATEETKAKGLGTMTKERWEALAKQLVELGLLDLDKMPNIDEILAQEP
jgi:NitT/TauT family transport system substrate-binding protein